MDHQKPYYESYYNLRSRNDQLEELTDDSNASRPTSRVSRASMRNTIEIREREPAEVLFYCSGIFNFLFIGTWNNAKNKKYDFLCRFS